jgi:hypothetical protein
MDGLQSGKRETIVKLLSKLLDGWCISPLNCLQEEAKVWKQTGLNEVATAKPESL